MPPGIGVPTGRYVRMSVHDGAVLYNLRRVRRPRDTSGQASISQTLSCCCWSPAVADVDACIGTRSHAAAAPTSVPKQCRAAARRLEDCLEQQQRVQEAISS